MVSEITCKFIHCPGNLNAFRTKFCIQELLEELDAYIVAPDRSGRLRSLHFLWMGRANMESTHAFPPGPLLFPFSRMIASPERCVTLRQQHHLRCFRPRLTTFNDVPSCENLRTGWIPFSIAFIHSNFSSEISAQSDRLDGLGWGSIGIELTQILDRVWRKHGDCGKGLSNKCRRSDIAGGHCQH